MRICFFAVFVFTTLSAMSKSAPFSSDYIGVRTLDYKDTKRKRPVIVELWYPTRQETVADELVDAVWIHPKEVRDVSLADSSSKYPLIMMSHGHGGDRRDRSWLAEYLVKKGYIVASLDHHGNSWSSYSSIASLRFWERARDISFAIGKLLEDPFLNGKVDPQRIGFVGYSLGGMTGLALGGARAKNVKEILILQQEKFKEIDPVTIEKFDFRESEGDFKEPRIKAIALLCPAAFVYPPESLKMVNTPVALVASDADEVLDHDQHAAPIMRHLNPTKLKLFKKKISHYAFLNRVSEIGKGVLGKEVQTESPLCDRATVHKEVGAFVADFFKETL